MIAVRAGLLKDRVEIQTRTVAQDSYGDAVPTWTTLATVWASVVPLSGRELFAAQQVQSDVSHKVILRYRSDITLTTDHRILFGTRVLQIQGRINTEERNRTWEILCVEKVDS